jgi:hypothetical protein
MPAVFVKYRVIRPQQRRIFPVGLYAAQRQEEAVDQRVVKYLDRLLYHLIYNDETAWRFL